MFGILFITNLSLGNIYSFIKENVQKFFTMLWSKRKQKQEKNEEKKQQKQAVINEEVITPLEKAEPTEDVDVQYSFDEASGQIALKVEEEKQEQQVEEAIDAAPISETVLNNNNDYVRSEERRVG